MQRISTFSLALLSVFLLTGCDQDPVYVTTIQKMASDGLNLQAVTDLATKVKSAEEFEKGLNAPQNLINNLDLNEDNVVDFIKVTAINDQSGKGFSLTTEVAPNDEQELAVIQFEVDPETETATVETTGNSQVYGNHHYYHNSFGLTDLLIWNYFLGGHSYRSSWGVNSQPSYHASMAPVSSERYAAQHRGKPYSSAYQPSTRSRMSSPVTSPNQGKTATKIKAPLKNPSTSQRAFQARNPSKTVSGARGFGSKSTTSSSSRFGSSSSSRSSSSFGGGK